jgi:nucleoside-triphosphatase THEP1
VFHGKNALLTSEKVDQDLVVIDEIGCFELNGNVWAESVDRLRELGAFPMIWVVRKSLLEAVIQRWNVKNSFLFEVGKDRPYLIAEEITYHLSPNPSVLE